MTQIESSANSISNDQIVHTVPNDLKTLIRIVMKTFYNFELYLCMEMLMLYRCVKEDDLAELLRLDLKAVHQYLINLKKEKFLNEKIIMETNVFDGKQAKCNYFYINYKMFVNVVKYKLDKIRILIESEEKQFTTRANFKCTSCSKTYSDLDTKDIFLTMKCLYCGADVDEDTSSLPKQSVRNLLQKFNTQIVILFELLSKVEHICLADKILRPEPYDMTEVFERINPNQAKSGQTLTRSTVNKSDKWSGDKTRNVDILGQTRITINFDSNSSSNQNNDGRPKKELPSILLLNRVAEDDSNSRDSELLNSVKQAADQIIQNKSVLNDSTNTNSNSSNNLLKSNPNSCQSLLNLSTNSCLNNTNQSNNVNFEMIVMQKLLKHEKKMSSEQLNDSKMSDEKVRTANSTSSITITKKRNIDNLDQNEKENQDLNDSSLKKRRLNNGVQCSKRRNSDGIDNSDKEDYENDDELNYSDNENFDPNLAYSYSSNGIYIPILLVRNKPVRFDRITTKQINLMNDTEKDNYINICRQLYTEIYEN